MRVAKFQNQVQVDNPIWIFNLKHISNIQDKKLSDSIKERVLPYINDIENFVNKDYPFRSNKFSFSDLAKAINVPTSHLNYIFKYHAVVTFVEYRNYCRIKDAIELINQGSLDTLTLEGLAGKVGFSSYNSFFTAFKKQTLLAPKEYLNRQNNSNSRDLALV